jgi:hypothetical protein
MHGPDPGFLMLYLWLKSPSILASQSGKSFSVKATPIPIPVHVKEYVTRARVRKILCPHVRENSTSVPAGNVSEVST